MSQVQTGFEPHLQQDAPAQSKAHPALWLLLLLLAAAIAAWWVSQERPAIDAEPLPAPTATAMRNASGAKPRRWAKLAAIGANPR